jgi:hypothetical protein
MSRSFGLSLFFLVLGGGIPDEKYQNARWLELFVWWMSISPFISFDKQLNILSYLFVLHLWMLIPVDKDVSRRLKPSTS